MNCPNCSQSLPAEALFCGACGQAVAPPVLAPAQIRPFIEPPQAIRQPPRTAEPAEDVEHSACAECGAAMSVSDIFCGACGHVSAIVSAAFSSARDTSIIESLRPIAPERPADGPAAPRVRPPEVTPAPTLSVLDAEQPDEDAACDANDSHDAGDAPAPEIVGAAATGERFVLQFSTGESVTVTGTGLVGRSPISEPGEYFDHLVRVLDSTRSRKYTSSSASRMACSGSPTGTPATARSCGRQIALASDVSRASARSWRAGRGSSSASSSSS